MMKKKKRFSAWTILAIVAVGFALALLLSFLAGRIDPKHFIGLTFFALAFPPLLLINILFALFFLLNFKWIGIIPLLAIAINFTNIRNLSSFKSADYDQNPHKIQVMSYNVNLFDFYGHINTKKGQTRREILEFIYSEKPDIVCFQEYKDIRTEGVIRKSLAKNLNLRHQSKARTRRGIESGTVIFSRFPILRDSLIYFEGSTNMMVWADLLAHNDTLRVINFHLESIGFQKDDDAFYQDMLENGSETSQLGKGLQRLGAKISRASKTRAQQALILHEIIAQSPHPVIVCGDMNDTPSSFVYRRVSQNLDDSFSKRGFGLGTSYNGKYPSFRIDYILFSPPLYCENFTTLRVRYSDHFPIISSLKIP